MKVLVTGVAGQLGHDVMQELAKREIPAVGTDLKEGIPLDITDEKAVHQVLQKEKPTVILHCAAWTAVDLAEEKQKNGVRSECYRNGKSGKRSSGVRCQICLYFYRLCF